MTRQQIHRKNHNFGLLLIPLFALLALVSGALLYARVLLPRQHHAEAACASCHQDSARLRHPGGFIRTSGQNLEGLDQYSIQCLGCHSDKVSTYDYTDASVVAATQMLHRGSFNHSIGRSYAAAMATPFGSYRPIEKLSQKIQLPNGVVSCISCHDGNGNKHGQLVTTMSGSALCFECHDL